MSQLKKLVARFLNEPADVAFEEVATLLEAFGYTRRPGKKHHVFVKARSYPITVPTVKGRRVKRAYVRMIVDMLRLREWYEEQGS